MGTVAKWLFDIAERETSFARRGFHESVGVVRDRLEQVGIAFVHGYRAALAEAQDEALVSRLNEVAVEFRGFAFEGAAMGLALLDWLTPWNRSRVKTLLRGPGDAHAYMVHVGAGWVLARVPGSIERFLARFDPLLRWLAVDGYGFHEGFFHHSCYLAAQPVPSRLRGYAGRVFDQGLGRCLWFIEGANVEGIAKTISVFPHERQADLWSGAGLACVYAGEIGRPELFALRAAAGEFHPQLAQGAAFAAKARQRASNLTAYTDRACEGLCDMPALEAARLTDLALENLPAGGPEPAYELWRRRIQKHFAPRQELRP